MPTPVPRTYDVQIKITTPDKVHHLKITLAECPRDCLLAMPILSNAVTLLESSIGETRITDDRL